MIIQVEGLRKSFGAVEALRGVDFSVPEGKVLGLLGPNGAGKTTAVRILTTLLEPSSGRATVCGYDVSHQAAAVRRVIGLAGQATAITPDLTGFENLEMAGRLYHLGKEASRRRADDLLERLDLADAAKRQAKTYSGGMLRRLDLAASLIGQPRVLFFDEPTTGLDPRSRVGMWAIIRELVAGGTTLLLCTQYLDEADELADNIVVIDHGLVIASGTSEELKDASFSTAIGLARELQRGGIDRIRSMPTARSAFLIGRLTADTLRLLLTVLVMVGVGYAVGFRFSGGFGDAVAMVALAALLGLAVCCVSAYIGLAVKDEEAVQAFGLIWVFPLTFISSAFVQIQTMPSWLQGFARHQPFTEVIDALRLLALGSRVQPVIGQSLASSVLQSVAWLVGAIVIFVPLATRAYRRA